MSIIEPDGFSEEIYCTPCYKKWLRKREEMEWAGGIEGSDNQERAINLERTED